MKSMHNYLVFIGALPFIIGCSLIRDSSMLIACEAKSDFDESLVKISSEKEYGGKRNIVTISVPNLVNDSVLYSVYIHGMEKNKEIAIPVIIANKNDDPDLSSERVFIVDDYWLSGNLCLDVNYQRNDSGKSTMYAIYKKLKK